MNELKKLLKRLTSYNFKIQQGSLYSYEVVDLEDSADRADLGDSMPSQLDFEDLGSKFSDEGFYTNENYDASLNFTRIVILFKIMSEINTNNTKNTKNQGVNVKFQTLCETIIILLIDTLEVYLSGLFKTLAENISVKNLKKEKVEEFFKDTPRIKKLNRLTEDYSKKSLWKLIQNQKSKGELYFNFHNKNFCERCFSVIGFNLFEIDKINSEKIYQKPDGIVQKRHNFAHGKSTIFSSERLKAEKFSIRTMREYILVIAEFIHNVENTRLSKHKDLPGLVWSTHKIKFKDGKPTNIEELPKDLEFL